MCASSGLLLNGQENLRLINHTNTATMKPIWEYNSTRSGGSGMLTKVVGGVE